VAADWALLAFGLPFVGCFSRSLLGAAAFLYQRGVSKKQKNKKLFFRNFSQFAQFSKHRPA